MGIGVAARRSDLSAYFLKIFWSYGKLRSPSNQLEHLSVNNILAQRHHHHVHDDGFFRKSSNPCALNLFPKLDAVDLAYLKDSGKQHEWPPSSLESPLNVQCYLLSNASRYNRERFEGTCSSTCRYSTIQPGLSLRLLVNCATSNHVSSSQVHRVDVLKVRPISTHFDKESHLAAEQKSDLPTTLDDFQHEEIVGPTVEKDLSTTANELRDCLEKLTKSMTDLASAIKVLAFFQVAIALWCGMVVSPSHHSLILINIAGAIAALTVAYFLGQAKKSMLFFSKLEERSRLRIITLSVQVVKAFLEFIGRSNGVIRLVSAGVFLALLADIWLLYGNQFL